MPQRIFNAVNSEWMWDDTFARRMEIKRNAKLNITEWSGLDRDGRQLTVVGVSSRWRPMEMLDVYLIYADQDY